MRSQMTDWVEVKSEGCVRRTSSWGMLLVDTAGSWIERRKVEKLQLLIRLARFQLPIQDSVKSIRGLVGGRKIFILDLRSRFIVEWSLLLVQSIRSKLSCRPSFCCTASMSM